MDAFLWRKLLLKPSLIVHKVSVLSFCVAPLFLWWEEVVGITFLLHLEIWSCIWRRIPMQGSRIYMFIDRLCSKKDFMIRKSIFKLQQVVLELKVDFRTTPKVLFKEFYSINLY